MKKIAVLVERQFQDLEVLYPYYRLKEEGFDSKLVAPEKKEYKGKNSYPVFSEMAIDEALKQKWDAVVIPGGWAPDYLRRNEKIVGFVKKMFYDKKVVASICHGASVLVSARVCKNKRMTCFHAIKDDVIYAGGKYEDKEVVVDGNLVTSRKPEDLPAFCRETIKLLKG